MLTGLTLILTTNLKRTIDDAQKSYDTSLVHLLAHYPRLTITFLISPQIPGTSSSKLMHLRYCTTHFLKENRNNPTRLFRTITSIHSSAPRPMYSPSLLLLWVNSPYCHPPPPFPPRQEISPSCIQEDSLLQISPVVITPVIPLCTRPFPSVFQLAMISQHKNQHG